MIILILPRKASRTKASRQNVYRSRRLPIIGAAIGAMTFRAGVIARMRVSFSPEKQSLISAVEMVTMQPAPNACRIRPPMST